MKHFKLFILIQLSLFLLTSCYPSDIYYDDFFNNYNPNNNTRGNNNRNRNQYPNDSTPNSNSINNNPDNDNNSIELIDTIPKPNFPYTIIRDNNNSITKLILYIGYDWYYPNIYLTQFPENTFDKKDILYFPQSGGEVIIEIINNQKQFSLYIENYNQYTNKKQNIFYFDDKPPYNGVSSFSIDGVNFNSIQYKLVVNPNYNNFNNLFCNAHFTCTYYDTYLSTFYFVCKYYDGNSIDLIKYNTTY